jgi:hypothetical protein
MNCLIPECNNLAERNGYCASHNREQRRAETEALKPKKKYVIPKTSPKMKEDLKTYTILRKVFLESKPNCEAHIKDICLVKADQIHHKIGRGENLLNVKTWLAVCFDCHQWITLNPEEAIKLGFSEGRLSKK